MAFSRLTSALRGDSNCIKNYIHHYYCTGFAMTLSNSVCVRGLSYTYSTYIYYICQTKSHIHQLPCVYNYVGAISAIHYTSDNEYPALSLFPYPTNMVSFNFVLSSAVGLCRICCIAYHQNDLNRVNSTVKYFSLTSLNQFVNHII